MLDSKGNMFIEDDDIIELMLANRYVKILPRNIDSVNKFKQQCKQYGLNVPFQIVENIDQTQWNMPDHFKDLNIRQYILKKHTLNNEQLHRVDTELAEFNSRGLETLLQFLVYFVEVLRTNNIIYGVGRGSSVSSYVLYLIGVHRIDSFKFNLDIKEFLK
jgi:DNA polymerase III alpha subunit